MWQVDVRVGRLVVHDGALLLVKILFLRNVTYQSSFNLSVVSSIPLNHRAGSNSQSSDIVQPKFEYVQPISHFDRT